MELETLNEKVEAQDLEIRKLKRGRRRLKKKIKKLEKKLDFENNKTAWRVKDIIARYPISKSTVWLYVKEKKFKALKNSSRVTTFDAKEIEIFFKTYDKHARKITPTDKDVKIVKEREKANRDKLNKSPQSPLRRPTSK